MLDQQPDVETDLPSVFIVDLECIENGVRTDSSQCMGAIALMNQGMASPYVGNNGIVSFYHEGRKHIGVSDILIEKVDAYDNYEEIDPFIFHVKYVKSFDIKKPRWLSRYNEFVERLTEERKPLVESCLATS